MDHVTFGVPVLILAIAEDLDELFENGGMAAMTPLGKLCRVMKVTINLAFVLVVRILGTEDRGTHGAREMFNVVFALQRCDVGTAQGTTTLVTKEAQPSEIICFAKWKLNARVIRVHREELGGNYFAAVLHVGAVSTTLPSPECELRNILSHLPGT